MKSQNFLLIIFLFASCRSDLGTGKEAAKEYCHCMEEKRIQHYDFFEARALCDGQLIDGNKLYRIVYIENTEKRYLFQLRKSLRDSAAIFNQEFSDYLKANCCKISIENCDSEDQFQKNRRRLDTIR
jgi:hypothetical protein